MILDDICAASEIRASAIDPEISDIAERDTYTPKNLLRTVRECKGNKNAVIAEIKYKTPSDKTIDSQRSPGEIAGLYEASGACAVSVLTEPYFFSGSSEILTEAKTATKLPILRKDFIVSEKQIYETYAQKADSVLLISGVLKERLEDFISLCRTFQIEPLVEVRTRDEAENAINSGAELIGVNNRNLKDMKVDTGKTEQISGILSDAGLTVISESGIRSVDDVLKLKKYCDGFLIGTALMKSDDPKKALEGFVFA
ncbi:MAG: indole-3-glycerol-phosphate synthase [Methanomicrobiaceae archaeon]|nr:indole-3-glycerol-phosphate synthase [Methanomicrobiaceae archaeon]